MAANSWSQDTYLKAYRFAADAHQTQLVPGTKLSYIMHLSFVAMEVIAALSEEPHENGDLAVQCALLHDVIEDTDGTFESIESEFGPEVACGVLALTKDKRLPKEDQMADSLKRIRQQPREVWMVKMADRISNLGRPPSYWTSDKMRQYRGEAQQILAQLAEASEVLAARLRHKIEIYKQFFT